MDTGLLVFCLVLVLAGGVGVLLGRWPITLPIVFLVTGVVLSASGLISIPARHEVVKTLTEATLVMLLFADASTLDWSNIRDDIALPARLLGLGLPLTIALGAVIAWVLFPAEGLGFALLVATILAPTDAALGLPIFINRRVPVRIRRALNVESGLNGGLATPFITLFIALAVSQEATAQGSWLVSALTQIGLAVLVGGVVSAVGGKLLSLTSARMWTSAAPLQFAVLGLAFASYLGPIVIGGNGFVAAFVGGLAFGQITRHQLTEASEYTETTGNLFSLFVWAVFGSILAAGFFFHTLDWRPILYAILSLTVIRMLPVFLALRGERLRRDTQVVVGWFGPRGLASVIFGLMAIEALEGAQMETELLGSVVAWTVLLSVLAHGLSAQPLAGWYARRLRTAGPDIPELMDMSEVHNRHRGLVGAAGTKATDPHRHA